MLGDGPAHNSVNRAEQALSPSTVPGLRPLRSYPNWGYFALVVGDIGYGRTTTNPCPPDYPPLPILVTFQLSTGKPLWRHQFGGCEAGFGTPAISNGVLYVVGDAAMWAFNAATGAQIWRTPISGLVSDTVVAGDVVYASSFSGAAVYAFNAATGRVLWSAKPSGCCVANPVAVANGVLYVGTDHLTAYNATTGTLVFNSPVKTVTFGPPVVSNGIVFMQSGFSKYPFIALSATTGRLIWSAFNSGGAAAVDGSTVIVSTPSSVVAYDASTGHTRWTNLKGNGFFISMQDSIANGVVYDGSGVGLTAIDERTGQTLFRGSGSCGSPIVSHGAVDIGCDTGMRQYGL
jgi:outer membrane protein assembly factor BamB